MSKLKENYEKAVNAYIQEFEKRHEIEFEGWIGSFVGEVASFGDYTFNFSNIKYVIHNNISFDYFSDWY